MSTAIINPEDDFQGRDQVEKADILHDEVLVNPVLMNDAVDGENREHEMGMWAAVKMYPWACLWAFIMCFTIVSLFPRIRGFPPVPGSRIAEMRPVGAEQQLMPIRSWSRSTCF
jgi:hypothetical protein